LVVHATHGVLVALLEEKRRCLHLRALAQFPDQLLELDDDLDCCRRGRVVLAALVVEK
jgi:hypothetical protein